MTRRGLGVWNGRLRPCPGSPNCVCSDAEDRGHRVEPFALAVDASDVWERIAREVASLPRTKLVARTDDYLHAECRSRLLGFVDDLELQLRRSEAIVAVRSASRLGYSDLGVNRARVEDLRGRLRRAGLVR